MSQAHSDVSSFKGAMVRMEPTPLWETRRRVMTDCSQLQALLDGTKQERQALDDPETYCQDQCDPDDILCIKQCLRTISGRRQATDQEIANIENDMGLCTLFGGIWSF